MNFQSIKNKQLLKKWILVICLLICAMWVAHRWGGFLRAKWLVFSGQTNFLVKDGNEVQFWMKTIYPDFKSEFEISSADYVMVGRKGKDGAQHTVNALTLFLGKAEIDATHMVVVTQSRNSVSKNSELEEPSLLHAYMLERKDVGWQVTMRSEDFDRLGLYGTLNEISFFKIGPKKIGLSLVNDVFTDAYSLTLLSLYDINAGGVKKIPVIEGDGKSAGNTVRIFSSADHACIKAEECKSWFVDSGYRFMANADHAERVDLVLDVLGHVVHHASKDPMNDGYVFGGVDDVEAPTAMERQTDDIYEKVVYTYEGREFKLVGKNNPIPVPLLLTRK